MSNPFKVIAIGLVPTLNFTDWFFCLKSLFIPKYLHEDKSALHRLENKFSKQFENSHVHIADSGRTALFLLLKSLDIKPSEEVITQAFTCVAVPLAIQAAGCKVIWVDAGENYNIDIEDLKRKITPQTKAVILQHTFGIVGQIEVIKSLCDKHKIFLIEDCAHSFGIEYQGKLLGLWGDGAILSFGRDKVITGMSGGATITRDTRIHKKILEFSKSLPMRSPVYVWKLMFNAVIDYFVVHTYRFLNLGKIIHKLFKIINLEVKVLTVSEKNNRPHFYQGLSLASCELINRQLSRFERITKQRRVLTNLYCRDFELSFSDTALLSFPLIVTDPQHLRTKMKREGIFLGNWYDSPIAPSGLDVSKFAYKIGSCPQAEFLSSHIVNLPTLPSLTTKEANKIVKLIKKYEHSSN